MLLYIHTLSNHPPNAIKQIPNSIQETLLKNPFNEQIFNTAKYEYIKRLWRKVCSELVLNVDEQQKPKTRSQNIICLNPRCNKAVSTNIAKTFLWLINRHFPKSHRLHKIFNRNTVKVSYSSMQNMSKIYKRHNSKITSIPCNQLTLCNCRVKGECPVDGKCQTMDTVYNSCVTSPEPQKIYFGLAEGKWKQRYSNHKKSFNHKRYSHETTLSGYLWHLMKTLVLTPKPKWSEVRCAKPFSNISKKCLLCLYEKIGYYYLSKTTQTFKQTIEGILKMPSWE